jgi:hypothetical protein
MTDKFLTDFDTFCWEFFGPSLMNQKKWRKILDRLYLLRNNMFSEKKKIIAE